VNAGGNLLIQSDPGATTLYLGDEQLVLNTAANTVSGTRYYAIGGRTIAARTSAGTADYLTGDQQGTSLLSIDATTQAVTRRYYDPYGNPVGAPASSWPGNKGYVGGTTDTATGLVNLGAREYNPAAAAFISPDALLNSADPQDLNPYAYAADNPSTRSDPAGLMYCDPGYGCSGGPGHPGPGPVDNPPGSGGSGGAAGGGAAGGGAPGGGAGGGGAPGDGTGGGYPGGSYGGGGGCPLGVISCSAQPPAVPPPAPVIHKITNGTPASQATCTLGVASRFAGPSQAGCRPAVASGGGSGFFHWIAHTALPFAVHHWREELEIAGMGVCTLMSAGLCLAAGGLYTLANWGAD
jgi:RHS repeat-associated protein